ncbi:MAG: SdrD B-like domain-containing protein, partial [Planctomycetota bacterium]
NPANIVTSSGVNVGGINFGNFQRVIIGGTKFQDTNGNGIRNVGEPGLTGVKIYLDTNNNGLFDSGERFTFTGVSGNYSFANVGPGTFIVREVLQTGFVQTTANPANIVTSSGTNVGGVNFGNFQQILIGGTKFQDTNGNGVRDSGEPGLQGFTIYIDANNNHVFDAGERSTTTSSNGTYSFANLGPGTFRVREVLMNNFVKMTNDPAAIVATSGGNATDILFGNMPVSNLFTVSKLAMTGRNLTNYQNGNSDAKPLT